MVGLLISIQYKLNYMRQEVIMHYDGGRRVILQD